MSGGLPEYGQSLSQKERNVAMSVNRENVRVYISNILGGLSETDASKPAGGGDSGQ